MTMETCKFCHTSPGPGERICQTIEETMHGVGCVWMEIAKREDAEREAALEAAYEAADPDGWKYSRLRP
jgi:hypothetical protein